MKICSVGDNVFHTDRQADGRTDRLDEANNRFSQFCARVYKKKIYTPLNTQRKKNRKFITTNTLTKMENTQKFSITGTAFLRYRNAYYLRMTY